MLVRVAAFTPYGSEIAVVLVPPSHTEPHTGNAMLGRVAEHIQQKPIMLISIGENGFRAFATFQTAELLALLQLEIITFVDLDLSEPPAQPQIKVPF